MICFSVSQRIAAADLAPGLQYFGRSIHGTMDMNDDGLVDLAVGSLGAVVLLWLVFHERQKCENELNYKNVSIQLSRAPCMTSESISCVNL